MSMLWTREEIGRATGASFQGDWSGVTGVSIDSRSVANGDLFVALKDQRDGHDFVGAALDAGAGAALVTHVPDGTTDSAPLAIVADAQAALEAMARAARERSNAVVIAVTGSAGKTSTKEMLRVVLARQGLTHAAERSFNNHWGVPLTLARMPANTAFAIIEIGMSNPGEIAPLSLMARPDVAVITTIAAAHLEAFDDLAGIATEKADITAGLVPDGGKLIVCADVPEDALAVLQRPMSSGHQRVWFGTDEGNDWQLTNVTQKAECSVIEARLGGTGEAIFKLNAPGRHFALNALGALAAVHAAGGDPVVAAHDLAAWQPPAGRGLREEIVLDIVHDEARLDLFDDAFNANPASIAAALTVLADHKPRVAETERPFRRVAILGDMLELGPEEASLHADIARLKTIKKMDVVHTVGPRMAHLHAALKPKRRGMHFDTAADAASRAHELVRAGDAVLVKGSKGSYVSQVVDAIRKLGHREPTGT